MHLRAYPTLFVVMYAVQYLSKCIAANYLYKPQTYIAATTSGRLFMVNLTSSGGQIHFTSHVFAGPVQRTSFIPSLIWGSTPAVQPEPGNISAVVWYSVEGDQRQAWALIESRIQQWDISEGGWETLVCDHDVRDTICDAMEISDSDAVDMELVDMAVEADGELVVLVSYAGSSDKSQITAPTGSRRSYSLVRISRTMEGEFEAGICRPIPYQSVRDTHT